MMSKNLPERKATSSEIVFYQTENGRSRIEVRLEGNTVWLTQRLMAELFQTTPQNITMHVRSIYGEGLLGTATYSERFSPLARVRAGQG